MLPKFWKHIFFIFISEIKIKCLIKLIIDKMKGKTFIYNSRNYFNYIIFSYFVNYIFNILSISYFSDNQIIYIYI